MGLDIWFRDDVKRILASIECTMRVSSRVGVRQSDLVRAYQTGFEDALRAVALAFGVDAPVGDDVVYVTRDGMHIDAPEM